MLTLMSPLVTTRAAALLERRRRRLRTRGRLVAALERSSDDHLFCDGTEPGCCGDH